MSTSTGQASSGRQRECAHKQTSARTSCGTGTRPARMSSGSRFERPYTRRMRSLSRLIFAPAQVRARHQGCPSGMTTLCIWGTERLCEQPDSCSCFECGIRHSLVPIISPLGAHAAVAQTTRMMQLRIPSLLLKPHDCSLLLVDQNRLLNTEVALSSRPCARSACASVCAGTPHHHLGGSNRRWRRG